ncbi:hypothetical protein [Bradyrhizobium liaoningense]|uniref:hypothetical protein n=1 Tax=Bradyrhizobium liaoningense TaxID=43992 RepID=UPI001BA62DC4|nr:hypothetical protein [Bradyrhizobium liaoningense]MBR0706655.1 hypothetical protein [Bradyrhizobium liaoningense]
MIELDPTMTGACQGRPHRRSARRREFAGSALRRRRSARELPGVAHDEIKAERRTKLLGLVAPVDGVVQQLAVYAVGDVVTPA